VLSEVEEAITDHVSCYREILNRNPLSILVEGERIQNHFEKSCKDVSPLNLNSHFPRGKESLKKGAVYEGIEKDLSPLKTRSARRLGNEKQLGVSNCFIVIDVQRELREQKSLARVKN